MKKRYTEEQVIKAIKSHESGKKWMTSAAITAFPRELFTIGAASTQGLK